MDVCLPLTLTGPAPPRGAHILSLCFLFIYLSAYFYPCDQDSDVQSYVTEGELCCAWARERERERRRGRVYITDSSA